MTCCKKPCVVPIAMELFQPLIAGTYASEVRPLHHHGWSAATICPGRDIIFVCGQYRMMLRVLRTEEVSKLGALELPMMQKITTLELYGDQPHWLAAKFR